ncbi:MAG: biopolymer transporter ExbD [Proteobacteria bacterium]|nr:biopolymer transporter ExbD [Pseudomonadota bacterium]
MAEINVTPLVDVMLVLLIIFMITTPLMNHKIKVTLPEAVVHKPKDDKKVVETPVTITVTENGDLFLNDEPTTKPAIESRLSVEAQKQPQPPVQVRADATTPYRLVGEVVKIAQAQGMAKIGFVTTPPKRRL